MPRREDWEIEISLAMRRDLWTVRGPMGLVKVLPRSGTHPKALSGYVTVAKNLIGLTPAEIENKLGLPHEYLYFGARIYRFSRIPQPSEYTYELTTYYPDGLAYSAFMGDQKYKPGSKVIHQWKLNADAKVPFFPQCLSLAPNKMVPASWANRHV